MDEAKKKRVLDLYGCSDSISAYLVHSGTKIGSTTKAKLQDGLVDNLDEDC